MCLNRSIIICHRHSNLEIERTIWITLKRAGFQIRCKQAVKSSHIISNVFSCLLWLENVNIESSEIIPQKKKCHAECWHSLVRWCHCWMDHSWQTLFTLRFTIKWSIQNFWYTTSTYLVSSSISWSFLQAQEAWYASQNNQKSMSKRTTV